MPQIGTDEISKIEKLIKEKTEDDITSIRIPAAGRTGGKTHRHSTPIYSEYLKEYMDDEEEDKHKEPEFTQELEDEGNK